MRTREQENKRVLGKLKVLMIVLCLFILPILTTLPQQAVYASEEKFDTQYGQIHEYIAPNGQVIEYFLDDNDYPFQIINGEKFFVLVSNAPNRVTDKELIDMLEQSLPQNPYLTINQENNPFKKFAENISTLSAPTATATIPYNGSITGWSDNRVVYSPVFHQADRYGVGVKTSNHSPFTALYVNLIASSYNSITDSWEHFYYDCVNITLSMVKFAPLPSGYVRFTFTRYSSINSMNYAITREFVVPRG